MLRAASRPVLIGTLLLMPALAGAATLKKVYSGGAVILSGDADGVVTADIGADVVKAKSFLIFSSTVNHDNADRTQIRGHISGARQLTFARLAAGSSSEVQIRWSVVEFTSGATVHHGLETLSTSPPTVAQFPK